MNTIGLPWIVSVNRCTASGETPLLATTRKWNTPLVFGGITPTSLLNVGSMLSHDGAPTSESVGVGKPESVRK